MHRIAYIRSMRPLDMERQLLEEWEIDNVELIDAPTNEYGMALCDGLASVDGVICENGGLDAQAILANPQLRAIGIMGASCSGVDVDAATNVGCWVFTVSRADAFIDACIASGHTGSKENDTYALMRTCAFRNALAGVRGERPENAVNNPL